ncbi:MAG: hypothetical protein RBG13Loki_2091 [Promethearchaeota archaeon CR_4]|nr:MAG: hypothetical protein RBG13Loki_2091 [Candidatus Lokiarchaeota archaeon CR_4]
MSEYPGLKPTYATAVMYISTAGHFSQILVYDYQDLCEFPPRSENLGKFIRTKLPSPTVRGHRSRPKITYKSFLEDSRNYEKEIRLYWENMQEFLDEEKNIINGEVVRLEVVDCTINFRGKMHPFVQWLIEFTGTLHEGENCYENYVESEVLEYPIHSTYILEPPLKATKVTTSLEYHILKDGHIVEYHGETGAVLSPHEKLDFIF